MKHDSRISIGAFAIVSAVALISSGTAATVCFDPRDPDDGRRAWAFEIGVAFMTSNRIEDIPAGQINVDSGPAGGEIYALTASRLLGDLKWHMFGQDFTQQVEIPLTLSIVDENSRSPFFDIGAAFVLRWTDFPWDDHVTTTMSMGVGLSYAEKIYLMDIQRHLLSDRSHVKFTWPIQLTLALPDYPDHQLMLYVAHRSGGHIFDQGGTNALGIGYRRDF